MAIINKGEVLLRGNPFDAISKIDGKVWKDKPMLLLATSPGARGGQTVLEVAAGRFPYMGAQIIGSLAVPSFFENFKEGKIVNTDLKSAIEKMVSDFEKAQTYTEELEILFDFFKERLLP